MQQSHSTSKIIRITLFSFALVAVFVIGVWRGGLPAKETEGAANTGANLEVATNVPEFVDDSIVLLPSDEVALQPITEDGAGDHIYGLYQTASESVPVEATDISEFSFAKTKYRITRKTVPVTKLFTPEFLSLEQDEDHNVEYYTTLLETFDASDAANIYTFWFDGPTQDDGKWQVTVIPNKPNYTTLDAFVADFGLQYAGGYTYPIALSAQWLVFASSCGGGGNDETANIPIGSYVMCSAIEPTIQPK